MKGFRSRLVPLLVLAIPVLFWLAVPMLGWTLIYFEAVGDERQHFHDRATLLHDAWGIALEPSCHAARHRLSSPRRPLSLPPGEVAVVLDEDLTLLFASDKTSPILRGAQRDQLATMALARLGGGETTVVDPSGDNWWVSFRVMETSVQPTCRFIILVATHSPTRMAAIDERVRIALPASIAWLAIGLGAAIYLRVRTERRVRHEREEELSQAVHRLHALHEFSERLVDSVPVGVLAIDGDLRITGLNRAQEVLSGVSAIDVIGRPITEVFPAPADGAAADFHSRLGATLTDGNAFDTVYRSTRVPFSSDEKVRYRVRAAALRDGEGNIVGAVVMQEDQSTEARLEQVAFEADKLASVGVLAAGVAHEINNPLTSILGYSKLMLESKGTDDPDHRALTLVAEEATRVQEIVRNLLDFARPQHGDRAPTDINQVIRRSLGLVAPQLRRRKVEVITNLATDLPSTLADGKSLSQVFVNLFTNAARAMESGGKLTITTEVTHRAGPDGSVIGVHIEDTGTGIAPADLPRIFDPFYTTHSRAGGTGLGLAISRGIVEEHRGKITVSSELGHGSRFDVYLPLQATPPS